MGGLSAPFKVRQGIRQGCSISEMLYILSIQPYYAKSASVLLVYSCTVNSILSAYADDIVVLVGTQKEINTLGNIVNAQAGHSRWHLALVRFSH